MAKFEKGIAKTMSRRTLISGAAVGAIGSTAAYAAPADQTPSVESRGPLVWLDMTQQELDDAYDQMKYAPNAASIIKRYTTNSNITTKRIGDPRRFSYGKTPDEGLDVFTTKTPNAPILIFIHGGAWLITGAGDYRFPADAILNAGAHYIALDFTNVKQTDGNLLPLADQVRSAVAWVAKNASNFGGDPNRIYICGHSSGAHLGGTALITDWTKYGLPADVIKGALLVSGMYDLKPVRLSSRSRYVKFTDEIEDALSTQRHIDRISCPVSVIHGSLETPEFQRQSRAFAEALKAAGKPSMFGVAQDYNHFEVIELLANPYSQVGRATLEMMNLAAN